MKREKIESMKGLAESVSGHPGLPEDARVLLGLLVEAVQEMAVIIDEGETPEAPDA